MAHLYVWSRSDAPSLLNIGKSHDPESRAATLQSGHCFWVKVEAVFKGYGHFERQVHQLLQHAQVPGARQAWFHAELQVALSAIALTMQTRADQDNGSVTTQDEDESPTEVSSRSLGDELYRCVVQCKPMDASKATCVRQALRERVGQTRAKQLLGNAQTRTVRDVDGASKWVFKTDCGHLKLRVVVRK